MENDLASASRSGSFISRLWTRIKTSQYTYLLASFFLPFVIMLGVYACLETHPFGKNSVLTLDLQAQYVYYYEEIRSLIVGGGSWLYSWKRTLGGEFMGIVAYYMGSPFNLLLALFPKHNIADAVMFIQLCKIGMMGLNFGIYIHKTRRPGEMKTIAFSIMYALCAYAVVQTIDPMWLDAVVFLPMLILGVESLIRKKKVILYILSLSLIFISNYYMGYMCGIFTFLYFCYYYFTIRPELDTSETRFFRSCGFRTFCRFALCTVAALGISAFMLYPAWYSLQFGKIGFVSSDFSLYLRFDFLDLFVKMLPGTYDSVNRQGMPMIFCGLITVLTLPLYYSSKAIPKRQKIAASCMLAVLVASFMVNTLDLVWHGFSAPNWLNYRYSYVFSFFVLTMACDALKTIRKVKFSHILMSGGVAALLVILIQKYNYTFQQGEKSIELNDAGCILLSLVLIIVYTIVITFIRRKKTSESAAFVLAAAVCVEMFVSSLLSIIGVQTEVGVTKYSDYLDSNGKEVYSSYTGSIARIQGVVDQILDSDKSFYRMESTVYRKNGGVNEPMAFGYNGISHSTSTLNANIIRMMNKLGYSSSSHWTKYLGGTPVSDALLGIKYVITKNDTLDGNIFKVAAQGKEGYQLVVSDNTIYAMQNTKALSVAYGVSANVIADMKNSTFPPYASAMELQNRLIMSMLSETDVSGEIFKGITAGMDSENCSRSVFNQTHTFTDNDGEEISVTNPYYCFTGTGDGAKAILDFTSPVTGPIYFHFTAANFGKTFKVYVNGSKLSDYFGNETSCVMKLGDFTKGESVTVELRLDDDVLYISKESKYFFYYVDYSALNAAFSTLESAEMDVEKYGNDYLKGTIDLPAGQTLIFTSIPYDAGWNVYIDGKRAETVMVMDSLLAVQSTEGFHEIEFRYMPKGYRLAFIITGIALVLFILFILFVKVKKFRAWVCRLVKKPCPTFSGDKSMIFPLENVPDEATDDLPPPPDEELEYIDPDEISGGHDDESAGEMRSSMDIIPLEIEPADEPEENTPDDPKEEK